MAQFQLTTEIVARSRANNWDQAKLEWELHEVYRVKEPRTCLCGHTPIIQVCNLQNKVTGATAIVGNHCVNTVLGFASGKIFQALKRVGADLHKSLNKEAILHAGNMGWITISECSFYSAVMHKRKLNPAQLGQKVDMNKRFL
jgi:hypothetical protein